MIPEIMGMLALGIFLGFLRWSLFGRVRDKDKKRGV